jgi:acid phosphatase
MNTVPRLVASCAAVSLALSPLLVSSAAARDDTDSNQWVTAAVAEPRGSLPGGFEHLVVIYEENHSFDNLYGHWGAVNGQSVNGLGRATLGRTIQVAQDGTPFTCLGQTDVNLKSPEPLSTRCMDPAQGVPDSHFINLPFTIDDYITPSDTTCPKPGEIKTNGTPRGSGNPGGCTRDLVHRFYQEQYQLNGGNMNRYVTGSDAVGLAMGTYRTEQLPIYRYLHSEGAPNYVVADHFFQAAYGGSFLNHQWLIAARSPLDTSHGALGAENSVLDDNGMVAKNYPLYTPTRPDVVDGQLTASCPGSTTLDDAGRACGDFAVNTVQPSSEPFLHPASGKPPVQIPLIDDTRFPNIGDRMTEAGISWAWYAGKWNAVNADPARAPLFQYHHQPFNYFANYAEGAPGRSHLLDENLFVKAAQKGVLPRVSFVKPYALENEHPGYASEPNGSDHLVTLLRAINEGPQADSTLVVVTYDEFGGQWDHVPPPGLGTSGVHDAWGPGTRIPALVISKAFEKSGVDHRSYDTTSILAMIERSFRLRPLSSRDALVNSLGHAVRVGGR